MKGLRKVIQALTQRANVIMVGLIALLAYVGVAEATTVGDVAEKVTTNMAALAKLVTAASFVAGMGFAVGAILKFKQHKDNPTQIPIGTPIALLFVAAALIFLPTIFGIAGSTLFGTSGTIGGISGTVFSGVQ